MTVTKTGITTPGRLDNTSFSKYGHNTSQSNMTEYRPVLGASDNDGGNDDRGNNCS